MNDEAERLAKAHWAYVEAVLRAHLEDDLIIDGCGFHYRTAFVHGFKHGVEWAEAQRQDARRKDPFSG